MNVTQHERIPDSGLTDDLLQRHRSLSEVAVHLTVAADLIWHRSIDREPRLRQMQERRPGLMQDYWSSYRSQMQRASSPSRSGNLDNRSRRGWAFSSGTEQSTACRISSCLQWTADAWLHPSACSAGDESNAPNRSTNMTSYITYWSNA